MQGVSEDTLKVLEVLCEYQELKPYFLIGGTAIAIKLGHRLSEDIDLFAYQRHPGKKFKLPNADEILKRFGQDFDVKTDFVGESDITVFLDGIKVQLRAEHQFHRPEDAEGLGHIRLPIEGDLLGMKLVALQLRDAWRDVFDLTCLAEKFSLAEFYPRFEKSMSTYYCGSKRKKVLLFNSTIKKLKDPELLAKLNKKDPMTGLITERAITPEIVLKTFEKLEMVQTNDRNLSR